MAEQVSNILQELRCPVCLDLFNGQVRQCKEGHNVCESHMRQLKKCPTCRTPYSIGSSRNILAETMVRMHLDNQQQQQNQQPQGNTSGLPTTTGNSSSGGQSVVVLSAHATPPGPSGVLTQNNNNNSPILCKYTIDGCDHSCVPGAAHRMRQHEQECHFRPVNCCLLTNGCHHAEIPFFDYIPHLTGLHGVKYLQGSHHLNKYVVKVNGPRKKFVRDGSTSLFILEVANQAFVVRAKEMDDWIHVWVAFHGHPDLGKMHKTEIQYNPQYEEDNDQNIRPRSINLARDYGGESSRQDDDDDIFIGNVAFTTRQTWEEVQATQDYLSMPVSNVEYNLKREILHLNRGRQIPTDSWAVTVTITREQPQRQN